ncbi:MAG: UDP-N-acetylglucosamine 2-epimerase (non-hydrolyzing) [Bacteroidota bacterium]|nr:UDP-N-acetylglucosamine 2-epimerase (non-hydrolyzing) [Bacteroidota bacterium]
MLITLIAGARPNFMKIAPLIHAIRRFNESTPIELKYRLVHTGQHYDRKLSDTFFEDLNIPEPDANLEVGSASHAVQTANIMIRFEEELMAHRADVVLVVGDVNSTMAATLVAKKMGVKVAHVEAGLRSFDMDMPEEINRLVTDSIADYFFTTTPEAGKNLRDMGQSADHIYFVGNTMIDTLHANLGKLTPPALLAEYNLAPKEYILLTLHRPSNVDDDAKLAEMLDFITSRADGRKIIFPVHPRTRTKLEGLVLSKNLLLAEPMRYLEFLYLVKDAFCVVTDSGGIQEETTYLGVPCMTLRENTERPETITIGTNELLGFDKVKIADAFDRLHNGRWKNGKIPEKWDGQAAHRIVEILSTIDA